MITKWSSAPKCPRVFLSAENAVMPEQVYVAARPCGAFSATTRSSGARYRRHRYRSHVEKLVLRYGKGR
jgi:hypothetical protein